MMSKIFVYLIKFYQLAVIKRTPCCRFIPSCSSYAIQALEKYGFIKGGWIAFKRILRCRPGFRKFSNGGYDPVP